MTALIKNRETRRLANAEEYMGLFNVKGEVILFAGAILAVNKSTLEIEPAQDAANLIVVGRNDLYIDNRLGGKTANARKGIFLLENSAGDPITRADIGKVCFIEDDQTVNKSGGTNKIEAGKVYDVVEDGVWVDMRQINIGAILKKPESVAVAFTANDPEFSATGAVTIADGDTPTTSELLALALEINAKVDAMSS